MIVDEIKTDSDITKEIDEIKAYFESKLKVGTDLSYEWIEKDENIKILSSIIFVNDKNIDTLLSKHDYGCELKLIKLITEDKRHKDNFVEVPKVCNRLNRYSNIIPYHFNKVYLGEEEGFTNYFNGCYISGPFKEDEKMFIATQGPLKQTVEHFWTMIKKEEVKLIFMLANLFEEGRSKCEMYWPKKRDTPITFDAIGLKVFLESEDYILDKAILRRNFILHDTINDTKRNVSQLHVVCWPDHSAPNEELGIKMIEILLFYTAEFKLTHKGSPIVVHCSAGVGRTGTFIAIHNIASCLSKLKRLKHASQIEIEAFFNVFNVVRKLREERFSMVTDASQYKYIYEFVLEWIKRNF